MSKYNLDKDNIKKSSQIRQKAKVNKLIEISGMQGQDIAEELMYKDRNNFYTSINQTGLPEIKEVVVDKLIEIEILKNKLKEYEGDEHG